MRIPLSCLAAFIGAIGLVHAQSNLRPGTNVACNLGGLGSPTGAHTGTFPNGEQSWGVTTTSCNVGTVGVPWLRDMNIDHPQIGMWMYCDINGRFEQISVFRGVKHGFTSTNTSECGLPNCPGGAGTSLVIGCSDTYGASLNYSHTYMAPPAEVNPWLATWTSRGSHFDRGFPVVAPPQDTDNIRSPITFSGTNHGYRNIVLDAGLNRTGGTFWASGYYNVAGEPEANRENNFSTRRFTATWTGSSWSWGNPDSTLFGSPAIYRWAGATVTSATNGTDDGRFYVGVRVTGPVNGLYHYEYATFNRDNNRQGGAVRIPVCATATVSNLFFRDPDGNAANEWTKARVGNELVFTAPAGNANNLTWGNLFNFAFDSDASPGTANVLVDQALAGAGAAAVTVASTGPVDIHNLRLGVGCGTPAVPVLATNGLATLGNAGFALNATNVAGSSLNVFLVSAGDVSIGIGGGCSVFVDPALLFLTVAVSANVAGTATLSLPIPNDPTLQGAAMTIQDFEVQNGTGAISGLLDATNGVKVKTGNGLLGCN